MGTDSSHNRKDLTCPECGAQFSFAVPSDSQVPIPCPECGAATPVTDEGQAEARGAVPSEDSSDAETESEEGEKTTAHGLPGQTDGGDATARRRSADTAEPEATTAHGLPGQSGEADAAPEEANAGEGPEEEPKTTREGVTSSSEGGEEQSSGDEEETEDSERIEGAPDLDPGASPDGTFQGVGPAGGQPAIDAEGGETTRADVVEHVSGMAARPDGEEETEAEESEDGAHTADASAEDADTDPERDSDASHRGVGSQWSTPPPQDAVDADEEQHGAVTQEMDSVPEILADSESGDFEEAEPPEPAYETEPDGRTLVRDESDQSDESDPSDESTESSSSDERDASDESERSVESSPPDGRDTGSGETVSEEDEASEPTDRETEPADATDGAGGLDWDEESEPVRASEDVGYRVDPSTNLEVAADEAMARATEVAQDESAAGPPDREREILELREQIPDEAYRVRVENYVYTDVSRERLAEIIAEGRVFAIDAVATEEGEWRSPSEHPAFEHLRRQTADEAHRLLDAAPESQSREIDLEELEQEADASHTPPPVPEETESEPEHSAGPRPPVDEPSRSEPPDEPPSTSEPSAPAESGPATGGSEPPEREETDESDSNAALITLSLLLFALAGVIVLNSMRSGSDEPDAPEEKPTAASETAEQKREVDRASDDGKRADEFVVEAVSRATEEVARAADIDPSDPQLQDRVASRLRRNDEPQRASRILDALWEKRSDDPTFARRYVGVLVEAERWNRARAIAVESIQTFDSPGPFETKFRETLEQQPSLQQYRPLDLGSRDDVRTIRPVERGDYPAYAIRGAEGAKSYLFIPEAEGVGDWRDQIAGWRLCELLECGFEIPETRAAKIDRASFDRLFEPGNSDGPAPKRSALEWIDRGDKEILRGAVRRWPSEIERWPIEATSLWRPWISGYVDDVPWDMTVAEALEDRPESEIEGDVREQIRSSTGNWTVRRAAKQLSNVLTYDYLTNNWGRFEEEPEDFGASHHAGPESFVTLRSETVFQNRGSRRVEGRFNWSNRFSEDFLTSLRLLEREETASILYPTPTGISDGKLRIFWRQRKRVLNRVDHLVGKSSPDEIVAFE